MSANRTTPRTVNLTQDAIANLKDIKQRCGMNYQTILERSLSWLSKAALDVQLVVLGMKEADVTVVGGPEPEGLLSHDPEDQSVSGFQVTIHAGGTSIMVVPAKAKGVRND